ETAVSTSGQREEYKAPEAETFAPPGHEEAVEREDEGPRADYREQGVRIPRPGEEQALGESRRQEPRAALPAHQIEIAFGLGMGGIEREGALVIPGGAPRRFQAVLGVAEIVEKIGRDGASIGEAFVGAFGVGVLFV